MLLSVLGFADGLLSDFHDLINELDISMVLDFLISLLQSLVWCIMPKGHLCCDLCGCYQSLSMSFLQVVNMKYSLACKISVADEVTSCILVEGVKKSMLLTSKNTP